MPDKPQTIAAYIAAAPAAGQPLLRELHALLRKAAPDAQEAIKWGQPFFIEPRFVYAFSAHKAHASFAPPAAAMREFAQELKAASTTKGTIRLPYDQPLPEALLMRIAKRCVALVREREDAGFWPGEDVPGGGGKG